VLDTIRSANVYLPGSAPAPQLWRFDPLSALIGAGIALLLAGLAYTFRDQLRWAWHAAVILSSRVQLGLLSSADDRYRELIVAWARSSTMSALVTPLDAIFVEPDLLAPLPTPESAPEAEQEPLGHQILPLRRLLEGHPQLAILGAPGTGKTTLLAYTALLCARTVEAETEERLGAAQRRLPLYVSLSTMDWGEQEQQDTTDREDEANEGEQKNDKPKDDKNKVERLLGAAAVASGGKSGLTGIMRKYLEAGRAIVLADDWDRLLPQQRQQATVWLAELIAAQPGNLWLVVAGTRAYAPLTEAGFVPVSLAPWNAWQVEEFARRWVDACTQTYEDSTIDLHKLIAELQHAARMGASPLELTLRAFVCTSDQKGPRGRAALFDRALDLLLWQEEAPWLLTACRTALGQPALQLLQEERAATSREEMEAALEAALPPPGERPANATTQALRTLTSERGLLRLAGTNHYAFIHPLWQAYLAARQLIPATPSTLMERLGDRQWAETLRFYAELGDMAPLVAAWMRGPDDVLHTRLRVLGSWASVAPEDAAWRDGAMAVLARAFLEPGLLAQIRQELTKILVATGMRGVTYLFSQALQHPEADIRAAAVRGLVQLAQERSLPALEVKLKDQALAVREAVVHSLATMNTDAAMRMLEQVLLEGDDVLRPIAAEALARFGEQGVDILTTAVKSEDVVARRAAVFGLAVVEARDILQEVARKDDQWVVRSAATAALEKMEQVEKNKEAASVPPPPEVEQLPWLISWAATRGQGVGRGEAALSMLRRALGEGNVPVRLAAAQVLAQVGRPDDVELLRNTLDDADRTVASAAFEALAEISARYDLDV
jgi:hypothetical protein